MATLLIKLVGPMQSWGTTSRFNQRDTGREPSKSGVMGVLAAALGIHRENWSDLEPLTQLSMGVRHDRPGVLKYDFQTAGGADGDAIIKADGSHEAKHGVISKRYYLADAAFLVGVEAESRELLERIQEALRNPVWPLSLGRKSYVPSEPIWIPNGVQNGLLIDSLRRHKWIGRPRTWETPPSRLLVSLESDDGSGILRMDQPLASFADRRFGARFIRSEWIDLPQEVQHVSK